VSLAWSFPSSLLRSFLLACSGRGSVTVCFKTGVKCVSNFIVCWWWMERNGTQNQRSGGDANLLPLNFYSFVFPTFSVFKVVYHEYLCVFSVRSVMSYRSLRNVSLSLLHIPFLGLIKRSYHGWLIIVTSPEGSILQPCLGSPNFKSTTRYASAILLRN